MDIANETDQNEVKQLTKAPETIFRNEKDSTPFSVDATIDQSLEKKKKNQRNPMLLSSVIRCVLKFLNIEEIKNCRLVSHKWGSNGKVALSSVALIHFSNNDHNEEFVRRPMDFQSCFTDSAFLFSSFKISGFFTKKSTSDIWTTEELTTFFDVQQKYIIELTLDFRYPERESVKSINLYSWISKSPMAQKDTKHVTKLSIEDAAEMVHLPLHTIALIKDLSLSNCRIDLEAGIKICPIKLKLAGGVTFLQDGIKLDRVRINDIVDLCRAKEISLNSGLTTYIVDLRGNATLDNMTLQGVEIVNGGTSEWIIKHLATYDIPYSLNSQSNIKELYLCRAGTIDMFTLPNSIQKFGLYMENTGTISCSQPLMLENLQYLFFDVASDKDYAILSLFMNCPQLTHLKLYGFRGRKSLWIPESIKTLTLESSPIKNWVDQNFSNLGKLVLHNCGAPDKELCKAKIMKVEEIIIFSEELTIGTELIEFLEYREEFNFCKRLYIGELQWDEDEELENCPLKEHVDTKSSFYVFESGKRGLALSETAFHDLIPKHADK